MSSPGPTRRRSATTVVAVVVVLVLVVGVAAFTAASLFQDSGGDGPEAAPPSPSTTAEAPEYPPELASFYEQELDWSDCGSNECTKLRVPLDYTEPDGETIELAVLRVPANRREQRVGQLMVNPGGPGGSAVQYASSGALTFGNTLARYFDIVGMDPRGVGQSTPLECGDTEQTDEYLASDPDPDTPAEVTEFERINREYGATCLRESGDLTRHMSTVEVAKDMDILRAALGEAQVDYLGASYGTLIGATYADLFPDRVRRMVLDGAVDPSLTNEELSVGQARGFETALDAYLDDCIAQGDCVLGNTRDEAKERIRQLFRDLDAEPLPTASGRQLTEGLARLGVIFPLYLEDYWGLLTAALTEAIRDGNGDRLLILADQYARRGPDGYTDNSTEAFNAVNCLDYADNIPVDRIPSKVDEFEEASPTFGGVFVYDMAKCALWPVKSTKEPKPLHAKGAPPIVVIGTTRDPATPYEWAKSLASQLDSGHLISRDGDGHTGFNRGNQCVDTAVQRFLVGGKVPEDGLSC